MERTTDARIEYILSELERLKVHIQRLESMLVPLVKDEVPEEELREIEMEARKFKEESEEWIDAEDLDEILEDEE
ncbi:hypothetical protein, conserved [Thermococcus kodakarensis KOD1]|uniref:Uncharacterized protein n=1 Tax=Thermococcus kodakarensis (strain ATCC BAA-918 / JCM 12380 / KOD1) TaxID=69014 RepID=Q5JGK7_THEKO|nr:DUF5646 family protein [Thermococcus kodakarensis]WCN27243.1 DUF5646 family protein [Thermococcus kodakarensis]WCN29529.1 DUF5646 family protein [Thermococcus kodakarensis]BAD85427.1 hypothetical protein, conserved [Thermococcus kodakarensis KOD1]